MIHEFKCQQKLKILAILQLHAKVNLANIEQRIEWKKGETQINNSSLQCEEYLIFYYFHIMDKIDKN